jgi:hypothetical protein
MDGAVKTDARETLRMTTEAHTAPNTCSLTLHLHCLR